MKKDGLSGRLRRCGVGQGELAKRCGVSLRGMAHGLAANLWQYVIIIELLETLTFEQRREWLDRGLSEPNAE